MSKYFGTDGIRGVANQSPLTAETILKVGIAAGTVLQRKGYKNRVLIGKDTRLSGYIFEAALVAGFASVGLDIIQVGPMPTPAIAMLTRSLRADFGVVISASHNHFQDNGIKIFGPEGYKLSHEQEAKIEELIDTPSDLLITDSTNIGRASRINDSDARYIEFVKGTLPRNFSLSGMRVVIDCANGAGYKVAPEALWEMGADVTKINVEPNGFNINKNCGSTNPQQLINKVLEIEADLGIALDGDADRVILVDQQGKVIDGDHCMAVAASAWKEMQLLSAPGVVATVMSNLGLEGYLNSIGLTLERTEVGDRHVVEKMRQKGYNIGGEQSGHLVFSDYSTTGDGLIAAIQIMATIKRQDKPASEVCNLFASLPQINKSVRYNCSLMPIETKKFNTALKEAKNRLGKNGRLIIRKSGTEQVIRIMGESKDETLVKSVVNDLAKVISEVA